MVGFGILALILRINQPSERGKIVKTHHFPRLRLRVLVPRLTSFLPSFSSLEYSIAVVARHLWLFSEFAADGLEGMSSEAEIFSSVLGDTAVDVGRLPT